MKTTSNAHTLEKKKTNKIDFDAVSLDPYQRVTMYGRILWLSMSYVGWSDQMRHISCQHSDSSSMKKGKNYKKKTARTPCQR